MCSRTCTLKSKGRQWRCSTALARRRSWLVARVRQESRATSLGEEEEESWGNPNDRKPASGPTPYKHDGEGKPTHPIGADSVDPIIHHCATRTIGFGRAATPPGAHENEQKKGKTMATRSGCRQRSAVGSGRGAPCALTMLSISVFAAGAGTPTADEGCQLLTLRLHAEHDVHPFQRTHLASASCWRS